MFIGQHQSLCSEKNSLEIPEVYRGFFGGKVVVTQGFEKNILILPVETFEKLSKLLMALNITDPLVRGLQRLLLGSASYSQIDRDGSIDLPAALKQFAGLTSKAILVGQGGYFEVWSQDGWKKQEKDLQDAQENSSRFSSLNLAGL